MTLSDERDGTAKGTGPFWVCVFSPSGKIAELAWDVEPEIRTLPEGPLNAYDEAVEEFLRNGAFLYLSAAEKADVSARVQEAGYTDLLRSYVYLEPADIDLPEAEAIAAATQAMKDYGFTDDSLTFFIPSMSLQSVGGQRVWVAEYTTGLSWEWWFNPHQVYFAEGKIGNYRVELAADTGLV